MQLLPTTVTWLVVQLDMEAVYQREGDAPLRALQAGDGAEGAAAPGDARDSEHIRSTLSGVVWTPSMRRMYTLLKRRAVAASAASRVAAMLTRTQESVAGASGCFHRCMVA